MPLLLSPNSSSSNPNLLFLLRLHDVWRRSRWPADPRTTPYALALTGSLPGEHSSDFAVLRWRTGLTALSIGAAYEPSLAARSCAFVCVGPNFAPTPCHYMLRNPDDFVFLLIIFCSLLYLEGFLNNFFGQVLQKPSHDNNLDKLLLKNTSLWQITSKCFFRKFLQTSSTDKLLIKYFSEKHLLVTF